MNRFETRRRMIKLIGSLCKRLSYGSTLVFLFNACAGDPLGESGSSTAYLPPPASGTISGLNAVEIQLNARDFYTVTAPNPDTSCPGDTSNYYHFLNANSGSSISNWTPQLLASSTSKPNQTMRPSFIKNVSVDLTDANSYSPLNQSRDCSYQSGYSIAPASSCAILDASSATGTDSALGGNLFLLGGVQNTNRLQPNSFGPTCIKAAADLNLPCNPFLLSVNLNSLPATAAGTSQAPGLSPSPVPSDPISIWNNLADYLNPESSSSTRYPPISTATGSFPQGLAGAASAYSRGTQQISIFGGASFSSTTGTNKTYSTTSDTWTLDTTTGRWAAISGIPNISPDLTRSLDQNPATQVPINGTKIDQGRTLFGMTAAAGMAISSLGNSSGEVGISHPVLPGGNANYSPPNSPVDTTERILITGGICNESTQKICTSTLRFNPTYGPESIDAYFVNPAYQNQKSGSSAPAADQWIDSYHTQVISNRFSENGKFPSQLSPYFPQPSPSPSPLLSNTRFGFGTFAFGLVSLMNASSTTSPSGWPVHGDFASPTPATLPSTGPNTPGAGYLLSAGGFYGLPDAPVVKNSPNPMGLGAFTALGCNTDTQNACGGLAFFLKWHTSAATDGTTSEKSASNFISLSNLNDSAATQVTPGRWVNFLDGTVSSNVSNITPWFGAGVLLKGINLGASNSQINNEVAYFGGSTCSNFLTNNPSSGCTWNSATVANSGRYWRFGPNPAASFSAVNLDPNPSPSTISSPTSIPWASPPSPPTNAGMAAARGTDPNGNPIIVAWGGMTSSGIQDSTGYIYYLYNDGGSPNSPKWGKVTPATGTKPPSLAHASLVFSHVTGSFYLFGGYNSSTNGAIGVIGATADTWKLSFDGTPGCGKSANPSCAFTWTKLTPTCYSATSTDCGSAGRPAARWGHQAVEVNYHYFNAPYEPKCDTSSTPCSFGIFMQGGQTTPGTSTILRDRWMFDPTANAGQGHWQWMGELPPRSLAAMTQIEYKTRSGSTNHFALLFGGETGLQDSTQFLSANYFVPPTLGDTWMFNIGGQGQSPSWNRVRLLGSRYSNPYALGTGTDQATIRAASSIADSTSQILSPPPLAGAVMVTRTHTRAGVGSTQASKPLALPEIFLFGGRNKEGKFQPLSRVYKFCAGSTGEKPNRFTSNGATEVPGPHDASCDAYDPVTNPGSPNPQSGYVGRWIFKNPNVYKIQIPFPALPIEMSTDQVASYLGAATYDSNHDRIVLYGGLTPSPVPSTATAPPFSDFGQRSVTDPTAQKVNGSDGGIFEYTPPSTVTLSDDDAINGRWAFVPACSNGPKPEGRYGHGLSYDPIKNQLVLSGGFNQNGSLLTQSIPRNGGGTSYELPQIWTATRIDTDPNPVSGGFGTVFPCYSWNRITTYGNAPTSAPVSTKTPAPSVPPNSGFALGVMHVIPTVGYNTGYYTLNGPACGDSQAVQSVGGVYIDLDRTQLKPNENLLLNVTLLPLGPSNVDPVGDSLEASESAQFRVNLVRTGDTFDQLQRIPQPRAVTYSDPSSYPVLAYNLAILAPPTGQVRQEQILIPLSLDPTADRIRIERVAGSGIILDAHLVRLNPNP